MKIILLIYLIFCILTLSSVAETENFYQNGQTFYVKFDNMRLRTEPAEKSITIDFIPLGESVTFVGEISSEKFTSKIQGKEITANWLKIKTIFNEEGWIFGGSLQKEKIKRKVNLIQLSSYHEDEAKMNSGTNFFGVTEYKGNYFIKKDKIFVRNVHDNIVDKENEKTGRELYSKKANVEYFFLLRGIDVKENFKIPGIKKGKYGEIRESLTIEDNKGQKYNFLSSINPKYKLILHMKNQKITLFERDWSNDKIPSIEWAGDINGDGILDFLIDDSFHYNMSSMTLYVSEIISGKITFIPVGCIKSGGC